MKKFYLVVALLGLVYVSSPALNKLTVADQAVLNDVRLPQSSTLKKAKAANTISVGSKQYIGAFVELAPGYTADDLIAAGANVNTVVDEFVTVTVPLDLVEEFAANDAVKSMQLDRTLNLNNNTARTKTNTHRVHAGYRISQKYTGAGVIAGLYDIGLDPHNPAFKTEDLSASRICRLFYVTKDSQDPSQSAIKIFSGTGDTQTASGEEITSLSMFSTDNSAQTHGTHVAGTMAGGKGGSTTYYGMAYEADLAMACGVQSTLAIVDGISAIAEYGLEVGKPVVINCSMGINSGSHDGTDIYSQMLDKIVEKTNAIISFSAGNEAGETIGWHYKYDSAESVPTGFQTIDTNGVYYGTTELWSKTDDPVKVTIAMGTRNDDGSFNILETLATVDKSADIQYFGSTAYATKYDNFTVSPTIDKYWSKAYYAIGSEVDSRNGRYVTMLTYAFESPTTDLSTEDYKYIPIFIVDGKAGQEVWGYCSGRYEQLVGTAASANGTINNMACAKSVISVGAYHSRTSYKTIDNRTLGYQGITVGDICDFSSFGELSDGRALPDICAPGSMVISAISSPYWNGGSNEYEKNDCAAYEAVNGRINAYYYMRGTSMACPVVTGIMALWKQADPDLTVDEARAIMKETADQFSADNSAQSPVQLGGGMINALTGIQKVIEQSNAGINDIKQDLRVLVSSIDDNNFEVYVAGETSLKCTLYNMNGVAVKSAAASGNKLTMDVETVAAGVYVLAIEGATTHCSQRVLVK